ncbi:helix-turn-helix domain-containing protein [Actinoallomurus rhizosphaericola]|uniref:helix-turn-helix domain-containing protein n=1 Tax=Actinoallomurus rhizosphaericola TaxID=2952536 RepID=UPI002091CBE2|nr:helix-turn-helix transcriptional regulator [Actinoallomurus rhizosphaericola]MCO5992820.1 helix-turn-helix domain-containing protein [Actinoallomurus rhizosphaericola]
MSSPSTYVQRFILGAELAKLRARTGLSLKDVQAELDYEQSWMSRVEHGERGMKAKDVRSLLDLYSRHTTIEAGQREELLVLARAGFSGKPDWWRKLAGKGLKPKFDLLIAAESGARVINAWRSQTVPGILQTEPYARALIEATDIEGVVDTDERIEIRRTRQEIITRRDDPVALHVILDEAVLHHQIGGPEVLRGQLDHLVQLGKLDNVRIQVLPYKVGAHAAVTGDFVLLVFQASDDLGMVYLETATTGLVLQSEHEVRRYSQTYGTLQAMALPPTKSADLIASAAKDL